MYKIRVLLGGHIFIVRMSDKSHAQYNEQGKPVYGNLDLAPNEVLLLASNAQQAWLAEHVK